MPRPKRKDFLRRCQFESCTNHARYLNSRMEGIRKRWLYVCDLHDKALAFANLQRYYDEAAPSVVSKAEELAYNKLETFLRQHSKPLTN